MEFTYHFLNEFHFVYFGRTDVDVQCMGTRFFLFQTLGDNIVDVVINQSLFEALFACRIDAFTDNQRLRLIADEGCA